MAHLMDYDRTLVQFARAMSDDYFAENPGIGVTKTQYDELYPPESRIEDWLAAIWTAARQGRRLRAEVLDDLFARQPMAVRVLSHHYGDASFPSGYLTPNVRTMNRAAEKRRRPHHQLSE